MKICMFTGHRPKSLPFGFNERDGQCVELKIKLAELIREKIESGIGVFITGMALGVDCYAAEIVIELKKEFPHIRLEAVIPCADQPDRWSGKNISRYNGILEQCDNVTTLQEEYTPYCMHKRNRYMVEHSDCAIAVWNGNTSGTGSTVDYARKKGLPVTILDPITFSVKNI